MLSSVVRNTVVTRTLYSYRSAKEYPLVARAGRARTGKRDPNRPAVAPAPLPAVLLPAHLAAAAMLARYRRVRSSGGLGSRSRRREPRLRYAGERRAGGRGRRRRCTPPRRCGVPGTVIGVPGGCFRSRSEAARGDVRRRLRRSSVAASTPRDRPRTLCRLAACAVASGGSAGVGSVSGRLSRCVVSCGAFDLSADCDAI